MFCLDNSRIVPYPASKIVFSSRTRRLPAGCEATRALLSPEPQRDRMPVAECDVNLCIWMSATLSEVVPELLCS